MQIGMMKANVQNEVSSSEHFKGKVRNKALRNDSPGESLDEKGKRKDLQLEVQEKGGKRKRQKIKETTLVEINDCFSQLPEHIVHHILGLLKCPKDATRTSILSKKWKSIWDSFPIFDIDQRSFEPQCESKKRVRHQPKGSELANFAREVDKSLATRLAPMSNVQRFKLHMCTYIGFLAPRMNCWIAAAMRKNVKELDIHVNDPNSHYRLPRVVYSSETITSLKLYNTWLDESSAINLCNLRVLSIKKTHVDVDIIQRFVSSCPLLEDLRLVYCKGLGCLRLSALAKLNRVELHECFGLGSVEIEAENLQTLWFCGERDEVGCKLILAGCGNLRNLTLKDSNMTDDLFHDLISQFPKLEKLVLMDCDKLERIIVLSHKIKRLSLLRCKKLKEVDIDALRLISLNYAGEKMPFSSMDTSLLHELKLSLPPLKKKSSCLKKLRRFLGIFNTSEGFKLFECSRKFVTIYEEMKGVEILPCRRYSIELTKSLKVLKDLADSYLSKIHPKGLNVVSSPSSEVLKFIKVLPLGRANYPECCRYYSNKCWRHHLKEAKMSETGGTSNRTTFHLKWKPMKKPGGKVKN